MNIKTRYIHEVAGWPALTYQASIVSTELLRTLRKQGEVIGRVQALGFQNDSPDALDVTLSVLTDDAIKTSAIEGETLSEVQVRSSVARRLGIDAGLDISIARNVDGLVSMLLDATQNCDAPLTDETVWGWHAALFPTGYSGMDRITVGAWRTGEMQVISDPVGRKRVHYVAPDASRVAGDMERFLTWYNAPEERENYILKSAIAHLWFVTIHPLDDGNGRITRAITDRLLARSDHLPGRFYSLSSQIEKERRNYYDALEITQKGTLDITAWIVWYLGCLQRAMDNSQGAIDRTMQKAAFWRENHTVAMNPRQSQMINRMLDGWEGHMTVKKWERAMDVSRPTAYRDIEEMIRANILQELGSGRTTHYWFKNPALFRSKFGSNGEGKEIID